MTLEQKVDRLTKEVGQIKSLLTQVNEVWLSEKDAAELIGVKQGTLARRRLNGLIDPAHYKCRSTGRGFFYLKSELEKQFITSK